MADHNFFKFIQLFPKLAMVIVLSSCGVRINSLSSSKSIVSDLTLPRLSTFRILNFNGYLNSPSVTLLSSFHGQMNEYCLLANDTDRSHCVWTNATSLPTTFNSGVTNGPLVVTAWTRNNAINVISDPISTPSVTIDTILPTLASVTPVVTNPTNQISNWPLSYGAISETYAAYCLLQNDTVVNHCTWTSGTLPATYSVSAGNGTKTISVWVQDLAGNISARVDAPTITVNSTAPSLASLTINSVSPTNTASAPLIYGTITGSYTSYCLLVNDTNVANCTYTSGTAPTTFTFGADGTKTLSLWLKDAAGNVSTRVGSNSVVVDTVAPALASASISNPSPSSSTTYNLTYGAITNTPYAEYCILENSTTVSGCTFIGGTLPTSYSVTAVDGAKVLSVWLKDAAGNVSTRVDTNSVTLDRTAPTLASVMVTNTSPTNSTTYNLTYGAVGGTYADYCILENSTTVTSCSWTTGSLPSTFSVSPTENAKVFSVWLRDGAGNVSTRADSNSVTLDTTPPVLASASISNPSPTNTTVFGLTFGSVTGTYAKYCVLENSTTVGSCTFIAGTLPASYSASATQNAKVLSVWLQDAAGNVSTRVDTNSVTLVTTPPVLASATITNTTPTNTTTYGLSYGTVTGTYSDYCLLENSTTVGSCSWTTGTLPASLLVSSTENAKVVSVWIRDSAGNVSTRVDTNSVTLDKTAPVLASVTVGNSNPTNDPNFSLTYGAVTGTYASYCILENSTTVGSCAFTTGTLPSSFTVANVSGAKVLSVWLKDSAGNVSTRIDTSSITLDVSALSLASVTVTNTSPTNSTTYNLTYGTAGTYAKYCILENDTVVGHCTFTAGTLPSTYTVTSTENAKVLSVWIQNSATTVSSRVDANLVTLDTTAPNLASASIANPSPTNTTSYGLTYGAQTNGTYASYCILENSAMLGSCTFTAGTLPSTFTVGSTENGKVLSIWIKDAAGNVSSRVDTGSVTLDSTAPTLASAAVTNTSPTNSTTYNLTYGAQTGTYSSYCILENSTTIGSCSFTAGTLPSSFTVSSTNNAKVLSVWIKDSAGNVSTRVDTGSVTLDTSTPALASVTVTNSSPTNTVVYSLTYGTVTGSYGSYCILENSTTVGSCSWTAGTLPSSYSTSATENAKVLSVWIKTSAGTVSTRADSNSVTLDTTAPTLASATISNSSPTNTQTYALSFGAVTNGTYASYCILENSTTVGSCTFTAGSLPASYSVTSTNNAKVLSVWLKDNAGNVSTRVDTNSVTLNTAIPTLASATVTNTSPTNTLVYSLTYGTQSGPYATYCILENSTTIGSCSWTSGTLPPSYTVSSTENAKVLSIWIKNSAGSASTRVDTNSVTLDTTAPTLASFSVSNSSPSNTTTYSLTYGAQTGTYASYCILENSTTIGSCSWTAGTVPSSFTVSSAENAKVLSVWLKDAAGNVSARNDSNSVTLDTTAPALASAIVTNTDPTNLSSYSITYGAVTGTYASYCILENGTTLASCSWTAGSLPSSYTVTNTTNAKVLSFWLRDSAGNVSTRIDSNSVTYDNVAPSLASATVTNASPTHTTTFNLTYGTVAGSYSKYCILENATTVASCCWTTGTLPSTYTVSSTNGAKALSIWLQDSATNISTRIDSNSVTYTAITPFAQTWPFTAGTSSSYNFFASKLELIGGYIRLIGNDQTDDDNSMNGFAGGTTSAAVWDGSSSVLRINETTSSSEYSTTNWTPQNSRLVGIYHLNEASGTSGASTILDSSPEGSNGTTVNSPSFGGAGKLSTGATFNGSNNFINISETPNQALTGDASVCAWVRPSGSDGVMVGIGNYDNWGLMLQLSSGKLSVVASIGGFNQVISSNSLSTSDWNLVCGVRMGTTLTAYVNGVATSTAGSPGSIRTKNPAPDCIGIGAQCWYGTGDSSVGSSYFSGSIDEVGIWNTGLTAKEVHSIYDHQQARYVGTFTSRVMDALATGMSWTKLSWKTTLPFMKELTDYASGAVQNESSSDYSAQVGSTGTVGDNNLMSGIVGLWHFNESTGSTTVADTSGQGNMGTLGSSVTLGQTGKIRTGAKYVGNSQSIITLNSRIVLPNDFTFSIWANLSGSISNNQALIGDVSGAPINNNLNFYGGNFRLFSAGDVAISNVVTTAGGWHHYVARRVGNGSNNVSLYIDGKIVATGTLDNQTFQFSMLGADPNNSANIGGMIDEAAVWSRGLDVNEIAQLYRRGANRVKHQVRICTAVDCSDDASDSNWKGPDGTNQTYFSELNNNSVQQAMSGNVLKGFPSMLFSNFTSPVGVSRYFQYRTVLESDDAGTGCTYDGGSTYTWCSPELKLLTVDPIHYDSTAPTVVGVSGISYDSLTTFTETLGTSCAGGVGYNLGIGSSAAAATWYWWDSSANSGAGGWAASDGSSTKSNPAATVQSHVSAFGTSLGTGTVYVKAFLKSDGNNSCELDNVELDGYH